MKRLLIIAGTFLYALAYSQNVTVSFDLNYGSGQSIEPVQVKTGHMLPADAKPYPERKGYRFGGWYTSPQCKPSEEWLFGNNSSFFVPATDSMKVEKSMTLYAKWVSPKPVRTAADLDAIRQDLHGWYVLENDIDISSVPNWEPIGEYEASYEFAPAEWWRHSFKGILDGKGHTIRGLRITELKGDKAGLFGTMADGEILNLTLEDSRLEFTAPRPYVAPLVGIIKQDKGVAAVRNCTIKGTVIKVRTSNTEPTFHSFTGLCGGIWGGTLENNTVSGKIDFDMAGNGGGELYVGAFAGEAYNQTRNCTSDFDIAIHFSTPQPQDGFKAFIGGLQASATDIEECTAQGRILLSGETGSNQIFIGGIVGSERYGTVSLCKSSVEITVKNSGFAQVGGIAGEFNATYGAMGSAFGVTTTTLKDCVFDGVTAFRNVDSPVFGEAAGAGEPAPLTSFWGPSMNYKIENCRYIEPLTGFLNPPKEARPYVWWHWMSGNTSKEGIRKDLEWMHSIGIAGFHQFDAGGAMMQSVPPGIEQTPYLSDAWKENFAYAITLADSLGMEVGIASAPGWSSTGGPWVEPEDAMKKLTWRTLEVEGKTKRKKAVEQTIQLPEPYKTIGKFRNADAGMYASTFEKMTPWYQDIAVVAVRIPEAEKSLAELGATVSSSGGSFSVEELSDGDISNGPELPLNASGTHAWIQYSFPEPVTVRSFTLAGGQMHDTFATTRTYDNFLLYSQDGETWNELFRIPSSPVPQITADIPETTARFFRLMVVNPEPDYSLIYYGVPMVYPTGTRIHEWTLSTVSKVNHAEEKAGFASPVDLGNYPTPESDATVSETIDLTALVQPDGTLKWTVPAGRWRIYRFGASLTGKQNHPAPPEATGFEVDKLDPDAWDRYFHKYLDMYKEAAGGLLGHKGITHLMIDSYEAEWMTWTPKMEKAFRDARGYELRTWMPALAGEIIGSADATEGFLFDWRETIGELFSANYDRVNGILREYGMDGRYTESHESSRTFIGDGMDAKRSAAVPMAAIWTSDTHTDIINMADIRESASVAHIYGQNIVAGETFTTNGMYGKPYTWYPGNLKITADESLLSGLNRFFIHESAHQPSDDLRPGLGLLIFGQWFSRHETWAEYANYWMDYLARSCYMLQAGKAVADVLWYYGEDTNVVAEHWNGHPDVPDCYSYDFCSPHALLNCISVKDGAAVTTSGMCYKVVVLGKHTSTMSLEVLRKLHELVAGGVYLIGKEPLKMAGLRDNYSEFTRLVDDIWHSGRTNVWTGSVAEGMKHSGVAPDFVSSVPGVRFVHRVDSDKNIYWVRNFSGKEVDTDIVLRDARGPLTVLNPVTGRQTFGVLNNGKLHLGADDAMFIVSDPAAEPVVEPTPLKAVKEVALDGPWTVSFKGLDAPEGSRQMPQLASFTESDEPAVKYFSGTASYTNTFTLKRKDSREAALSIDLGNVGQMAEVFINGIQADFLWKEPYRIDHCSTIKPGKNTIEVRVTNVWVNRLIGDRQPGAEGHTYAPIPFYQADSPLIPSGLMGPVRIELLR